ncbi:MULTISPECIES: hypothetical protein [unclassified Rhizobium]|uniref:hypothetical protein n=1 Tax=unclassified Rhizobium TaxID=2613769 RepID=UPI000B12574C|nr:MULTISPECIES: hypothetical protein [unclassified Rhizobium]
MTEPTHPRSSGARSKLVAISVLGLALLYASTQTAVAAITYERVPLNEGGRLLMIRGEFEPSDDPMKLVAEYTQYQPSAISFDSNGGSVLAAIKIGRAIRALSANTISDSIVPMRFGMRSRISWRCTAFCRIWINRSPPGVVLRRRGSRQ